MLRQRIASLNTQYQGTGIKVSAGMLSAICFTKSSTSDSRHELAEAMIASTLQVRPMSAVAVMAIDFTRVAEFPGQVFGHSYCVKAGSSRLSLAEW